MTKPNAKSQGKYERLTETFKEARNLLIIMQDHPDPDAVACAAALRRLANNRKIPCWIVHGGMVGRSENRALVKYLDLTLRRLDEVSLDSFDRIALVDTQPGTGNNPLPEDVEPAIVIDHHPIHKPTRSVGFTDIRSSYGATATILCEYLQAADIEPEPPLATALLYGIISDTQDLGRRARKADLEAYFYLSQRANMRMLSEIQHGPLPKPYYRHLYTALDNARIFGQCIVTHLGSIDIPDLTGEIADLFVRHEDAEWCLCTGVVEHRLLLSLRARAGGRKNAGHVISRLVGSRGTGGGHHYLAGGQITLESDTKTEVEEILKYLLRRMKKILHKEDSRAVPLITQPNPPR